MGLHNIEVTVEVEVEHGYRKRVKLFHVRDLGFTGKGAFIIDGYTYPKDGDKPRGGWMTGLPISPLAYRREHGPGTRFPVYSGYVLHEDHILIFDDWGQEHRIYAPADILSVLVRDCETHELPNLKEK